MKRSTFSTTVASLLVLATFSLPNYTFAAVSDWQKGANIMPKSTTDFGSDSFKQSLQNLKADGANYVSLVVTYNQSTIYSTDV